MMRQADVNNLGRLRDPKSVKVYQQDFDKALSEVGVDGVTCGLYQHFAHTPLTFCCTRSLCACRPSPSLVWPRTS